MSLLRLLLVYEMRTQNMMMRNHRMAMFDAVAKPITSGIELCRATAPTALPMDHATEADDREPTGALQIPRWESCDHIADMRHRSRNVYPPTASQGRTRSLLNHSGHCLENCTGSRSGVDRTTISANQTTSNFHKCHIMRLVSVTQPGLFQPTLATVRRIAQDLIWRMKSQSHLKLHHPNRLESL